MPRIACLIVPGLPHHLTQLGNRGERVFFEDVDYALCRNWLADPAASSASGPTAG
jgi:putative transposase